MTITDEDREHFQAEVTDWHAQPTPDDCLPTAMKNILDDLAEREGVTELNHSLSDINDQLEYAERAATPTQGLTRRVDNLIQGSGYEASLMTATDFDQLRTIIDSSGRSFPICDLDPSYFEAVDHGYNPEAGRDGYGGFSHVVVPFALNEESILFYDPYIHFFNDSGSGEFSGMEYSTNNFYEWWSRPPKRWTFWIEQSKQQTLTEAANQ